RPRVERRGAVAATIARSRSLTRARRPVQYRSSMARRPGATLPSPAWIGVALVGAILLGACSPAARVAPPTPVGSAVASGERAELPTYAPGDRWIRNDGVYDLVRSSSGGYVFASAPGSEIELSRTLGLSRISAAGILRFRFSPAPELEWPLQVGRGGSAAGTVTLFYGEEPYPAELTWHVRSFERVTVPAGTFTAFDIDFQLTPRLGTNFSSQARARPPAVRRFHL